MPAGHQVWAAPGRLRECTKARMTTSTPVPRQSGCGSWLVSFLNQDGDKAQGSDGARIRRTALMLLVRWLRTTTILQNVSQDESGRGLDPIGVTRPNNPPRP